MVMERFVIFLIWHGRENLNMAGRIRATLWSTSLIGFFDTPYSITFGWKVFSKFRNLASSASAWRFSLFSFLSSLVFLFSFVMSWRDSALLPSLSFFCFPLLFPYYHPFPFFPLWVERTMLVCVYVPLKHPPLHNPHPLTIVLAGFSW